MCVQWAEMIELNSFKSKEQNTDRQADAGPAFKGDKKRFHGCIEENRVDGKSLAVRGVYDKKTETEKVSRKDAVYRFPVSGSLNAIS